MHDKQPRPAPTDRLIGAREFCDLLGISRRTLERRVARPDFPQPVVIPGSNVWKWRQSDAMTYIAGRPVRPPPSASAVTNAKSLAAARAAQAAKRRAAGAEAAAQAPEREPPPALYVTRAEIVRELARRDELRFDINRQTWAERDGASGRWVSAERVLNIIRETSRDLAQAQGRRWSGMAGFLRSVEQLARVDAALVASDLSEPQP